MDNEERLELYGRKIREALEKDAFYKLLTGKEYNLPCTYACLPADPEKVLEGIEWCYQKDPLVIQVLIQNLVRMSEDSEYSWLTLYYLLELVWFLERQELQLEFQELVRVLERNLQKHSYTLKTDQRWTGAGRSEGIWEDLLRLVKALKAHHGLELEIGPV